MTKLRTKINNSSHKQGLEFLLKIVLRPKENKGEDPQEIPKKQVTWVQWRNAYLNRSQKQKRLQLAVFKNQINQLFTGEQAAKSAVKFNHWYTRNTKNILIYKLNHLHL